MKVLDTSKDLHWKVLSTGLMRHLLKYCSTLWQNMNHFFHHQKPNMRNITALTGNLLISSRETKLVLISVTFGSYQESSHFLACKHCFSKDLSFRNMILEAVLFFSWTNWYHHSNNPYFLLFRRTSHPENLRSPTFPWQIFLAI